MSQNISGRIHRDAFELDLHDVVRLRPVVRRQLQHVQGHPVAHRYIRMPAGVVQLHDDDEHDDNNGLTQRGREHLVNVST